MSETHAQTVGFVRGQMLPPVPPPAGQSGPIRWIRENLVSNWFNAILTIVSLFVIWWLLSSILPWTLNGIWNAGSLAECREIRDARGLESAACWAVINERWLQMLFGFYPIDAPLLATWFYSDQLAAAGGFEAIFGPGADSTARIEFVGQMRADLGNLIVFFFRGGDCRLAVRGAGPVGHARRASRVAGGDRLLPSVLLRSSGAGGPGYGAVPDPAASA